MYNCARDGKSCTSEWVDIFTCGGFKYDVAFVGDDFVYQLQRTQNFYANSLLILDTTKFYSSDKQKQP